MTLGKALSVTARSDRSFMVELEIGRARRRLH
jgi:hypothetical protein